MEADDSKVTHMRHTLIIALVVLACSCGAAAADTAEDLLNSCGNFTSKVTVMPNGTLNLHGNPDANMCWGYFAAVQDLGTVVWTGETNPILGACIPPGSSVTQLIRVFVDYANRNPAKLNVSPGLMVLDALAAAFPCPEVPK